MNTVSRWDLSWACIRDGEFVLLCEEVCWFGWPEGETDPHTVCSVFSIVQLLPRSALWDGHAISETSLASHNGTLLAYGLWIALTSIITSEPGYKEQLCFLYILLLPPAVCRQRRPLRIGILTSVQQHQQYLGTYLKQVPRPTSEFLKKYGVRRVWGVKAIFVLACPLQ